MILHTEKPIVEFDDVVALTPRIVRAGEARTYTYLGPGSSGTCLIDAASTGGAFSAFTSDVEAGAGVPLHVHANEDEFFYVLEGCFEIQSDDKLYTLEAGMSLYAPRQIPHAFRNAGETTGRLFVVATPGGFEKFFEELDAHGETLGDLSTDAARIQFGQLLAAWGMQPVFGGPEPVRMGYPAGAAVTELGNHRIRTMVDAEQTGGAMLLGDMEVDPQGGPPPHIHGAEDEVFYLLRGRLELMVGDILTEIGPGDFCFAPRNIAHGWRNIDTEPAHVVGLVTPGTNFQSFARKMEQFIAEIGGMALSEMTDPVLLQRMGALFQSHQIGPASPAASIK